MKQKRALADWAARKIETEYRDDVCLLLGRWACHFDRDEEELDFHYYIPATSRSNGLALTFIIDGIGYDLFPMSWERVERMAEVRGDSPVNLDNAVILYARNEDDRRRFASLQARLRANLQNPHFMYNRALEALAAAMQVYRDMLFEENLSTVRESAGYICIDTASVIAFTNGQYMEYPDRQDQITALRSMKNVLAGFTDLNERIIRAGTADEQKKLCHDIIAMTRRFLDENDKNAVRRTSAPDFSELAIWYQELSYTWRRVYYWCDRNNPVNAYVWCCYLQNEVDRVGAEFGIADLDIFSAFDADDLPTFRRRAEYVEQQIIAAIEAHGATIESYPSVEEFLRQNG